MSNEVLTGWEREAAFAKERHDLDARQQAARQQEDAKLRAERLAALEKEKREQAEARRASAEAELKAQLRLQFMKTPAASEDDFTTAYPALRAEYLAREAVEAPLREKRALLARGGYRL
jgi:hypothetical protein